MHPLFLSLSDTLESLRSGRALSVSSRCFSGDAVPSREHFAHPAAWQIYSISAKVGPVNLAIQHVLRRRRARIRECFLSFAMCVYQKSFFLTHVSLAAAAAANMWSGSAQCAACRRCNLGRNILTPWGRKWDACYVRKIHLYSRDFCADTGRKRANNFSALPANISFNFSKRTDCANFLHIPCSLSIF